MIMGAWGLGKKKGWTNPYITDGLVAMWDVRQSPPTAQEWTATVGDDIAFALYNTTIDSDGGLQFAGTSSSYGELSQSQSAIFPSTNGTLEIVFKLLAVPSGNRGRGGVVLKSTSSSIFGLGLFGVSVANIVGSNNTSGPALVYGSNLWSDYEGDFIAVSVVYANAITYYLRGVEQVSNSSDSIGGSQTVTRIGNRTTATHSFHGNIYAIRVYSKQLTADEIAWNYSKDKQRFNLP